LVTVYALSLDGKEKKRLIVYAILHRLSFLYVLDIIRMLSQLEEALHYPMKWEKMDHHGLAPRATRRLVELERVLAS
ncbi:MAG: hypothetical protein JSV20_04780, partial [Candidatus Bathyarchaeota archaeon]